MSEYNIILESNVHVHGHGHVCMYFALVGSVPHGDEIIRQVVYIYCNFVLLSCHGTEKGVLHCLSRGAQVPAQVCGATQGTGDPGDTPEHRSDVIYMYMYIYQCTITCNIQSCIYTYTCMLYV